MSAAWAVVDEEDSSALVHVGEFDSMDPTDARDLISRCCATRRWVIEMVSGRPYTSMRQLVGASDDVLADLSWSDLAGVLTAFGRRAADRVAVDSEVVRAEVRELVRLRLVTTLR